jgi:hypothetical protein
MTLIVDFHSHVFPDLMKNFEMIPVERINYFRGMARQWLRPLSQSIHGTQALLRHLPRFARDPMDSLGAVLPLVGLPVESTLADLVAAMDEAQVNFSLVIAEPPWITNEFVLSIAAENSRLIPVVNIPKGTQKPGQTLKSWAQRGAKALKIHPAFDGEDINSTRYRSLLRAADELNLPVIVHPGCVHSKLLYRNPSQSSAENFVKWYETFTSVRFILAHMNFHEPNTALDLCEEFPNLWVDTSRQPAEVIGEAARRIGAERVLFGTDWPFLGSNQVLGKSRIQNAIETGLLNAEQGRLILGENAAKILNLGSL